MYRVQLEATFCCILDPIMYQKRISINTRSFFHKILEILYNFTELNFEALEVRWHIVSLILFEQNEYIS